MESQDKLAVRYLSVLDPSNLTTMTAGGNAPQSPTRQYEPDSKTAPASTSPQGSCVDASNVAASRDRPENSTLRHFHVFVPIEGGSFCFSRCRMNHWHSQVFQIGSGRVFPRAQISWSEELGRVVPHLIGEEIHGLLTYCVVVA